MGAGVRIVQVAHGYPPELLGGTDLYVARLARELADAGHEVSVFAGSVEWREQFETESFESDGISGQRVHRNDLYFDRWDKGYNPLVAGAFREFLVERKPDLVHVHHWIRLTTNLVQVAARAGVPAVVTTHDLYTSCPRVFRLRGEQGDEWCDQPMGASACLNCVPRWRFQQDAEITDNLASYLGDLQAELTLARGRVAPSRGLAERLAREQNLAPDAFRVLPHGSLADRFHGRPSPGTDGRIHLVYWSHLHPIKGAHLLLQAVAESGVAERFHVHLHGEPSGPVYRERLERLAGCIEVSFHGAFRPTDLVDATMDVAVIPTLASESYSFLLDEAVMLGVPILASEFGALAERATPRMMTFRRNDAAHLGERLRSIAERPEQLEEMRAARAPQLVSFREHVTALSALYADVVQAGPPECPAPDETARLVEQWRRRERCFQELVRSESWEEVVSELRSRVDELEGELRSRG